MSVDWSLVVSVLLFSVLAGISAGLKCTYSSFRRPRPPVFVLCTQYVQCQRRWLRLAIRTSSTNARKTSMRCTSPLSCTHNTQHTFSPLNDSRSLPLITVKRLPSQLVSNHCPTFHNCSRSTSRSIASSLESVADPATS